LLSTRRTLATVDVAAIQTVYPGLWALLALLLLSALVVAGCSPAGDDGGARRVYTYSAPQAAADVTPSERGREGEAAFSVHCAACHGVGAVGTSLGPPLVHKIYEPSHHSDNSIRSAVQNGVQSHHWQFGDMAPLPAVSTDGAEAIICYIRELQVAHGIADRAPC
jgi:mono/diheme cytochrome c family protein